ncbi:MAG: ice-binding family protein [Mariniphaga sp.]
MKNTLLFILISFLLLSLPNANFGQVSPKLGATSGFALFTKVGAFNNTGASSVVGNIGSNSYTPTGFPPGTITGTIYHDGDLAAIDAARDVGVLYTDLNQGGTTVGVLLGGQTLNPGVWNTGAAATLDGDLTLDGQGDPNALFILRIGGALSVGSTLGSNVVLINSASPNNVYWQVNGVFSLGAGSVSSFLGTVVANGAINLYGSSSLIGRGLSLAGAVTIASSTAKLGTPPSSPSIGLVQPTCTVSTGTITVLSPTGTGMTFSIDGHNYANTTGVFTGAASGNYDVTAKNSDGYVSSSTSITINAKPTEIIVANQSTSIFSGETFSVTPAGAPVSTTYRWTIPTYTGDVTGGIAQSSPQSLISGTLTIPSGTGSAIYSVTPTYGTCVGPAFSLTVTVEVPCIAVGIGSQPADGNICINTGNKSFAVITSGTAPFTFQWQSNNSGTWQSVVNNIPANATYTNVNTATLSVAGITTSGSYQYRCLITNCSGGHNATSNIALLTVNPLPVTSIIHHF